MSVGQGSLDAVRGRVRLSIALLMFAAVALFAASPASAGTSPDSERYIVVLKDEVAHPGAVARRHAENRGAEVGHVYGAAIKGYAAELAPEDLKAIRRDPSVAYVERDIVLRPTAQSVPTGVRRIGTLSNPTLDIDESDDVQVNADVAIIDSGVNTHPDLRVVTKTNCVVSGAGCADNSGTDGLGHGTQDRKSVV